MTDLSGVVSAISDRGLRLIRTATSLRIEGDCPPNLADDIRRHSASLLPFASIDPDSAEEVAQQQAAANSDNIRKQFAVFAEWVARHHEWASGNYDHQQLAHLNPTTAAKEIVRIKSELEAVVWAGGFFTG